MHSSRLGGACGAPIISRGFGPSSSIDLPLRRAGDFSPATQASCSSSHPPVSESNPVASGKHRAHRGTSLSCWAQIDPSCDPSALAVLLLYLRQPFLSPFKRH